MDVTYDKHEPTPHQTFLAERIEVELAVRVRFARTVEPDGGNGPSILFSLHTRSAELSVRLELYQDSYHIYANEAEVRILLPHAEALDEWEEAIVDATRRLLAQPLRIRVNRPAVLKWLPTEGAIYFSDGATGHWAGNLGAGRGHEQVFDRWYEPA